MVSNISLSLFNKIKIQESLFGVGNELTLITNIHKRYMYDFCNPTNKKIIEFNGILWHAKPGLYKADDKIKLIDNIEKTAKDIWEYDKAKKKFAESLGYQVMVVWEDDYKNDPDLIIKQCMEFLYGKNNENKFNIDDL